MNRALTAAAARYWASIMTPFMIASDLPPTDLETRKDAEETFALALEETIAKTSAAKIGIHAAEGRYTPFLKSIAGDVFAMGGDLLETRFGNFMNSIERRSTKIVELTAEVFVLHGEGRGEIIEPKLEELSSGNSFEELVASINTRKGRPWLVLRTAQFWEDLVGDDPSQAKFKAYHGLESAEFWEKKGVTAEALELMRPGGVLWKDADEATVGANARWILLGRIS